MDETFIEKDLQTGELPPEYENVYCSATQFFQESDVHEVVVFGADHDRRQRVDEGLYLSIGVVRVEFDIQRHGQPRATCCTGTATLFAGGSFYILTCAHNLVHYDPTTETWLKSSRAWFELRVNTAEGQLKKYECNITKRFIPPSYFNDPSNAYSGYDIALCKIQPSTRDAYIYISQLYAGDTLPRPISRYAPSRVGVVGYPDSYKGEKYGMVAEVPPEKKEEWDQQFREDSKCLVYSFIDTSDGQSGSPVLGIGPADAHYIVGIHTGGSAVTKKNWATYLSVQYLEWIAKKVINPCRVVKDRNGIYSLSSTSQ